MAVKQEYVDYILDQLSRFGEVETKKMFGGVGLYHDGKMFGLIGMDIFCLKVEDSNQADYESRGMKAFMSSAKKKGMPYWEVPADVVEDKRELAKWAKKSFALTQK